MFLPQRSDRQTFADFKNSPAFKISARGNKGILTSCLHCISYFQSHFSNPRGHTGHEGNVCLDQPVPHVTAVCLYDNRGKSDDIFHIFTFFTFVSLQGILQEPLGEDGSPGGPAVLSHLHHTAHFPNAHKGGHPQAPRGGGHPQHLPVPLPA